MASDLFSIALMSKCPMVLLLLKKYETMVEYTKDIEDKIAIRSCKDEASIPRKDTEKKFNKKLGSK